MRRTLELGLARLEELAIRIEQALFPLALPQHGLADLGLALDVGQLAEAVVTEQSARSDGADVRDDVEQNGEQREQGECADWRVDRQRLAGRVGRELAQAEREQSAE